MRPIADLTPAQAAFVPMLAPLCEALEGLVVPGKLLAAPLITTDTGNLFAAAPTRCPHCREDLGAPLAQFRAHGRLWQVDFCFRWHEHEHAWDGWVTSVPEAEATAVTLPDQEMQPWRFLLAPTHPRRLQHAVMRDLEGFRRSLDAEDQEDFEVALEQVLNARLPKGAHTIGRLGGTESAIQDTHETVTCPTCAQPMTFLGQLDEETGFPFADGGACYFLACLDHPEHTHFDAQTH